MDGRVYIWDVKTGELVTDLIFHTDTPKIVKFSPKYLLMASCDSNLALWTPPPL
jgi:WD40 repeat protein